MSPYVYPLIIAGIGFIAFHLAPYIVGAKDVRFMTEKECKYPLGGIKTDPYCPGMGPYVPGDTHSITPIHHRLPPVQRTWPEIDVIPDVEEEEHEKKQPEVIKEPEPEGRVLDL